MPSVPALVPSPSHGTDHTLGTSLKSPVSLNAHVIRPVTRNVTFCQVRLLLKVFTSDPVAMETSALTVIADECVKFGFLFFCSLWLRRKYHHLFTLLMGEKSRDSEGVTGTRVPLKQTPKGTDIKYNLTVAFQNNCLNLSPKMRCSHAHYYFFIYLPKKKDLLAEKG